MTAVTELDYATRFRNNTPLYRAEMFLPYTAGLPPTFSYKQFRTSLSPDGESFKFKGALTNLFEVYQTIAIDHSGVHFCVNVPVGSEMLVKAILTNEMHSFYVKMRAYIKESESQMRELVSQGLN